MHKRSSTNLVRARVDELAHLLGHADEGVLDDVTVERVHVLSRVGHFERSCSKAKLLQSSIASKFERTVLFEDACGLQA